MQADCYRPGTGLVVKVVVGGCGSERSAAFGDGYPTRGRAKRALANQIQRAAVYAVLQSALVAPHDAQGCVKGPCDWLFLGRWRAKDRDRRSRCGSDGRLEEVEADWREKGSTERQLEKRAWALHADLLEPGPVTQSPRDS